MDGEWEKVRRRIVGMKMRGDRNGSDRARAPTGSARRDRSKA